MASTKLEFRDRDDSEDSDADRKVAHHLRDFLQPSSQAATVEATSSSILDLLPKDDPQGDAVSKLSSECIELARQIPYSHPAQLKLVRAILKMSPSSKVTDHSIGIPFKHLGSACRDNLDSPNPERPQEWVNFHAFVAKLEANLWSGSEDRCTWALWSMRDAFEQDDSYYQSQAERDAFVLASAQYILFNGQCLAQHLIYSGEPNDDLKRCWKAGSEYSGPGTFDLQRWKFWRDGFRAAAEAGDASEEIKSISGKAARLMDLLVDVTPGMPN